MVHRERRIQEIAYLLWEQEGRPHGEPDRFWHAAVVQYETEIAPEGGASQVPASHAAAPKKRPPAKATNEATKAETPAPTPKAAKPTDEKPKSEKSKAAKAKDGDAPSVAVKGGESELKPKAAKAKPKS